VRTLIFFILILSVFFMPWWVSVCLGILGIIYFSYYIEAVIIFLLSDLLYGATSERYFGMVFVSAIAAILFLWLCEFIKTKLRLYPK